MSGDDLRLERGDEDKSIPTVNDTPRSFSLHPEISLSGSDQSRSHRRPARGEGREISPGVSFATPVPGRALRRVR